MAKPKAKPVRVSVFMPVALDKKIEREARRLKVSKSKLYALIAQTWMDGERTKVA